MGKDVVDLMAYKIEKTLKENGFQIKRDKEKNIMLLIKLRAEDC